MGRNLILLSKPSHGAQQQMTSAKSNSPRKLSEHAALCTGSKARPRLQQLGQGSTKENTVFYNLHQAARRKLLLHPGAAKAANTYYQGRHSRTVEPCSDPRSPTERPLECSQEGSSHIQMHHWLDRSRVGFLALIKAQLPVSLETAIPLR